MNIQLAISEGTKILNEKSILTANIDSEILLANVIKKDRKYLALNSKKKNHPSLKDAILFDFKTNLYD